MIVSMAAANGSEALAYLVSDAPIHLLLTEADLPGGVSGVGLAHSARHVRADLRALVTSSRARDAPGGGDTGFEGKEGTFTICSFWLVTALAMIGETERAHALCQKLLAFAGPLQLYAEEIDTTTGEHLGNFPQAFTHLALIEAVSLLISSEQ